MKTKQIIGHYKFLAMYPNTYWKAECFGKREIPRRIRNRVPLNQLKDCCQVLIKSIGTGYQWININNSDFLPI